MPTINEVIARVDRLSPNAYPDEDKARWLIQLDGQLWREVFLRLCIPGNPPREYPRDGDKPLLTHSPYDGLYDTYLRAQMESHRGETAEYQNTATAFNVEYDALCKHLQRTHMPRRPSLRGVWW
ncbi:MAG: hypothetical protein LBC26_06640 [Oscillospiraceae bacterium]|jgi:hypothetical protein|nr:hypothetical protein [Oscillospiraceae bacterium]